MAAIQDYSIPVHRSVMRRELYLGIPLIPLVLLLYLTVLVVLAFGQWAFLMVSTILWYILRRLTDKDEWLLDIVLSSLLQPDRLDP